MTRMRAPRFQYTRVESVDARATVERVLLDDKTEAFLPMFYRNRTRIDAGSFSTASDAALAHDLLTIAAANEAGMDLTSLKLHTDVSWIQGQPYYLFIQTATSDRVAQLLRTDPSTFGLVSPSMKLARTDCGPPTLLQVPGSFIPIHLSHETNFSKPAPPAFASSSTVSKDSKSPQQRCKVRTNWASFPEGAASQSVVLTRFQVQSGNISMPIARCHAVLGAFPSSCFVSLKDTATEKLIKVGYKVYPSQPTQIFLQGFKAYFAQHNTQAGDVLTIGPLNPEVKGHGTITRWPATHPKAQEFRHFIRNGWSIHSISVEASRTTGGEMIFQKSQKSNLRDGEFGDADLSSAEYGSDLLCHLSNSPPAGQTMKEKDQERVYREEEELLMHFQKRAQFPENGVVGKKPSLRQIKNAPPRAKRTSRRHQVTSSSSKDTADESHQSGIENISHPLPRRSDNDCRREVATNPQLYKSKLRTTRHGKTRKVAAENLEVGRRRKSDIPHRSSYGERTSLASTLVSALCNLDTNR